MTTTTIRYEVEIDTALATAYSEQQKAGRNRRSALDGFHYAAGDKRSYSGHRAWGLTDAEAEEKARNDYRFERLQREIVEADAALAEATEQIDSLNARYTGWSRFFLVTSSKGHIHSSLECSTCYDDTEFAWLPTLSGLTEADAVEEHGEILCSICFPSAPAEWTNGSSKADKEAKEKRAADKAEREAKKLEKALLPDGSPLTIVVGNGRLERITTLAAAKGWLTDAQFWGRQHPSFPPESVVQIAKAVSNKTGESVAEVLVAATKRAEKRR
jgi:hypothetical protein